MNSRHTFRWILSGMVTSLFLAGCQNSFPVTGIGTDTSSSTGVVSGRTTVIQATAHDNVGVTKVEFYVNSALTCTVLQPPYNCSWQVPPGSGTAYQLQTKAYDARGNVGTSSIVRVTAR